MNIETYHTTRVSQDTFTFTSCGHRGQFVMKIDISLVSKEYRMHNLGFGFWSEKDNLLDDTFEARNGDTDKNDCFFGQWPFWAGEWCEFKKGVNYDAFLLNLK